MITTTTVPKAPKTNPNLLTAAELCPADIGQKFRSVVYPSNNPSADPKLFWDSEQSRYTHGARNWRLESLRATRKGIVVNNEIYLRFHTQVERVIDE